MAIEARVGLLGDIEKRLGEIVTVAQLMAIMPVMAEVLGGYEVKATASEDAGDIDLLQCFLDSLRVGGRSEGTINGYRYRIKSLMKFTKVPISKITVYHLRSYFAAEQERGIADTTLKNYREIFSSFFGWLTREGLITKNPVANLSQIKCAKKKMEPFSDVELKKIEMSCKTVRDSAIVAFLQATGGRIGEVTRLNRKDVDLQRLECVVYGKGKKERRIYLSPVAGMIMEKYLATRKDDLEPLFIGKRKTRFTPSGVRSMLRRISKISGVPHVHPHRFRRTLATGLTKHGMPVQEVAVILGHEKIDTTMKYVVLNDDDVRNSYHKFM